jgi:hypothetical protein
MVHKNIIFTEDETLTNFVRVLVGDHRMILDTGYLREGLSPTAEFTTRPQPNLEKAQIDDREVIDLSACLDQGPDNL